MRNAGCVLQKVKGASLSASETSLLHREDAGVDAAEPDPLSPMSLSFSWSRRGHFVEFLDPSRRLRLSAEAHGDRCEAVAS